MNGDSENAPGAPLAHRDDSSALAVFEQHRGLLFSIAYRMLGSVADAEDMLQETFIRWQRASGAEIRSPKAFLVTVVSRLCINELQSARVQREAYPGEWLPEPLVTEPGSSASGILQVDESVSMALLLLLERLTPAERAVFLLHEVFDYKHAEIAEALNLTEANSRQLLRTGPATCPAGAYALPGADRGASGAARTLFRRGPPRRHGSLDLAALRRCRHAYGRRGQSGGPPASDLRTG